MHYTSGALDSVEREQDRSMRRLFFTATNWCDCDAPERRSAPRDDAGARYS